MGRSLKMAVALDQACAKAFTPMVEMLCSLVATVNPSSDAEVQVIRHQRIARCANSTAPAEVWHDVMMGRYQIDMSKKGVLGEGSSCICRKGRDVETGKFVAIKMYKPPTDISDSCCNREACMKKHERSIEVLKKLQEPFQQPEDPKLWNAQLYHVKPAKLFMRLLDYTKDEDGKPCCDAADGNLYVVTELAQQSLKDFVIKKRADSAPPSKETVRSMASAILLVMAGLHAKGFVHLDVKPENLMVFDGCLKLIDVDGCVEIGTQLSLDDPSISFSPVYCAPEWASFVLGEEKDHLQVTPGLDAWSVGCTICELVTLEAIMRDKYCTVARGQRNGSGTAVFMEWLQGL